MAEEQKETGLYEALPPTLGGSTEQVVSASLVPLLPFPEGAKIPDEQLVNDSIRNRALLLDADLKPTPAEKEANDPRAKRTGRGPIGKVVIPKEEQKYELYTKLNELWNAYAKKALGNDLSSTTSVGEKILRMDWHGAIVEVVRARDPGIVGVTGILVVETARTVVIVTKKNKAITVLKGVSVIQFVLEYARIEVSLQALQYRASERSARKIKKRHFPYL